MTNSPGTEETVLIPEAAQSPEQERLAADVTREFEKRRDRRRPLELKWRLNQRFIAGDQYCDLMTDASELIEGDAQGRAVYNMIAPIVETRLSKLSRVRPGLTVRPQTADASDESAAKLATRLLKNAFAAHDMPRLQTTAARWAEVCGCVFYKSIWNPRAGLPIGLSEKGEIVHEGDLGVSIVPAFEIFPECPTREGLESQRSLIHARVYPVREIEARWGAKLPGRTMSVYGAELNPSAGDKTLDETIEDAELVIEYYENPSREFPCGRQVTVAGGRVLHDGALPFRNGACLTRDFPFVQQLCLSEPGCFFGATVVERLIPLQRDYNAIINRINEHTARMTAGNILAEQGSLVNEALLDEGFEPGTVVEYRAGATPPVWMPVSEVPESLLQRLTVLRRDFNEVSGVSDMARASSVGSVSSGVALDILREQDDTRLALTGEHIRRAVRSVGCQWLRLMRQFAVGLRIARVAGEDEGDLMLLSWQGDDLTSDDVTVDTDSELSDTPAQRRQTALELMNAGFFLDPDTHQMSRESRARLMEIFRMGSWENAVSLDEMHIARARREQAALIRGEIPKLTDYDDHRLHLTEHTRFMLGADYRRLQTERPALARAMAMHAEAHRALMEGRAG